MKPSEVKEIKDLLIQTRKEVSEYRSDLSKASEVMTSMLGEEVAHITKNQSLHQEKDDKMFSELKEGIVKTQVNHDEIIRMLQKSADDRKVMGEQISTLVKTQEQHKKIVSRGEGILWFLGILFSGEFVNIIYHYFKK